MVGLDSIRAANWEAPELWRTSRSVGTCATDKEMMNERPIRTREDGIMRRETRSDDNFAACEDLVGLQKRPWYLHEKG